MRKPVLVSCIECVKETGRPSELIHLPFNDEYKYVFECAKGHSNTYLMQQQKFEVLYYMGANAILDGYYRDAVVTFASSLERFYEFAIRVILKSKKIPDEIFKTSWKRTSRSEQQLGAFIMLWTSCFAETPALLDNEETNFRNEVVHNGKIPTQQQATDFGNKILLLARPQMLKIQQAFKLEIEEVKGDYLKDIRIKTGIHNPNGTIGVTTPIDLASSDAIHNSRKLEDYLDDLSTRSSMGSCISPQ